ncbi:[Fe-Fe] hydrogenase large subunit C-terminal domain-containing protein [Clostridium lundense]|uniref:[Fe-Fe] hydrogenase large subunit C-terminal domain-containing protein n=1 Tax=Clostridium lundense TaxID=319475 RepID=UPI000485F375|nr:[Fe-Fe] hydrogenase large subunit C-terminal domain-containing protein [Clostridium lundense]
MSHMNFSRANCKNCYKCLRSCPVKAIKFKNEQAEIVEERCISCGHCLAICPQNARNITSDLDLVRNAVRDGKRVVGSIAPSFAGFFRGREGKLIAALKKMGFYDVEETAVGAEVVTELYKDYINENKLENYITTCCPSANYLIEKYFPKLIPYIIPIVSPMIAHGKILKDIYQNDSFTVFIGPCAAKKVEADSYSEDPRPIDAVLTYEEIQKWIEEENINIDELEEDSVSSMAFKTGRGYPIHGGIIKAVGDLPALTNFDKLSVSGMEECIELLNSIEQGNLNKVLVEISACKGSCIGGPNRIRDRKEYFERMTWVKKYIEKKEMHIKENEKIIDTPKGIDFYANFKDKSILNENPSDEEVEKIMKSMGKYSVEDELNCGVCGYDTCKEKAKAIYNGMAEPTMCLHYMRSKAENITNVIFENTATCIILLDGNLKIKEINPAGEEVFLVKGNNVKDKPISILMGDEDFRYVIETGKRIIGKKIAVPQYNAVFIENIVYLPKQDVIMASMVNIMQEEKNREELIKVKENTLNAAQEVIDKQMRVAQEIASLLGETTAETKIILSKLKKVVEGEEGEIR